MSYVSFESIVPIPRQQAYKTLLHPSVYKKLVPDKLELSLVSPEIPMKKGAEYEFKLVRWGFQQILSLRVDEVDEDEIVLAQSLGFFQNYKHIIRFGDHDEKSTRISHYVEYDLQFGLLGRLYDDLYLRRFLGQLLETCAKRLPLVSKNLPN